MIGFSLAILAGILISLQSVFNTKVNENVGQWLTTTCVLGIGLISSV
ncbi:DMT family transporter, partial [Bacillus sp. BB081]